MEGMRPLGGEPKQSGACGLKDMPVEVLHKIAERLDLASQVELRHTSKHLHKALQDKVQFVKSFESACSVPLDATRCTAEAFALCGIELLSHLPATFDPATSQVTVVYMDEKRKTEEACIWSRHPRFQFQFSQGSMEKFEERNREVFICRKPEVHQMLCNAPFKMKNCDVQRVAGRLVLTSRPAASMEDLHQCAQYCFELMCSRRWFRSVLYIAFPPPPPHPAAGKRMHVPTPHYAVRIDRHVIDTEDVWLVDGWYHVPFPVKLDFACFPQDVFCVEAHFEHNIFAKSKHPRYKALTDYLQPASDRYQQCMRFVYEANGVPPRELLLIRNEHRRRRH